MPSNDQFVTTNDALCVNPQPVNAALVKGYNKVDLIAIPNSTPTTYCIIFQMKDGSDVIWKYRGTGASAARNADFTSVNTALATTV